MHGIHMGLSITKMFASAFEPQGFAYVGKLFDTSLTQHMKGAFGPCLYMFLNILEPSLGTGLRTEALHAGNMHQNVQIRSN